MCTSYMRNICLVGKQVPLQCEFRSLGVGIRTGVRKWTGSPIKKRVRIACNVPGAWSRRQYQTKKKPVSLLSPSLWCCEVPKEWKSTSTNCQSSRQPS